ncbi:hypothetical protein BTM_3708 [Burkholderia thailandensis 34]|uniref:hypothetical protein n=1 Tax=Burkholderia thailandensis TaxID=57975 RepID=UPI0005D7B043|nr:hypothetical protein [Burkholderia thailandensis]AJY31329.1 hypothetical protein BTM_3708 [Burkholderia thailandensis 34]AOJ59302.1 hypothetical protein AQ477_22360 [Burkholderia thailandensis]KXF58424.1 hypothetical protein AQ476_27490 [Burkholderia thailandensis]PNE78988.1 hypothetical protein A8H37_13140 [Burkholderia thailandensis]
MKRNLLTVTLLAALVAPPVCAEPQPGASSAAAGPTDSLVNYQEFKMPSGPDRVRRTILTTDPDDPRRTVTIDQVLTRTGPDKLTFVRGEQPADATLYRQKICQKMGGVDATNDGEITINDQILNFSLCRTVGQQPVSNKNASAAKLPDYGITIIVPAVQAKFAQQSYLPMHVWTSTPVAGNVDISISSGATGFLSIRQYGYAGVNTFQPTFTFKPFVLGTFPVTARACAPQVGGQDDKRGIVTVVR